MAWATCSGDRSKEFSIPPWNTARALLPISLDLAQPARLAVSPIATIPAISVLDNVRGRHVYLVQSTAFPANDNFMELIFWIDAFKRASCASVTAIMPYFSYQKGDKKDEPRVSIRARVCADAIEAAGASRVVTLDLHAPQIQGLFKLPVDDLYAVGVLSEAAVGLGLSDLVVVSPDIGFAQKARHYTS